MGKGFKQVILRGKAPENRDAQRDAVVRCVNKPVLIHEGKTFQAEKLLYLPLVRAQMIQIAQIVLIHQAEGNLNGVYAVVQVILNDLLPTACQLLQIQQADGTRRFGSVPVRDPAHHERAADQDGSKDDDAANDYRRQTAFSAFVFMVAFSLCFVHPEDAAFQILRFRRGGKDGMVAALRPVIHLEQMHPRVAGGGENNLFELPRQHVLAA